MQVWKQVWEFLQEGKVEARMCSGWALIHAGGTHKVPHLVCPEVR